MLVSRSPDLRSHSINDTIRPTTLAQSSEFLRALTAYDRRPLVLPDFDNTIVTQRRFFGRFNLAMINRASLASPRPLLDALRQCDLPRTPVILSPNRPCPELGQLGAVPLMSPAYVALLDLPACETTRRAALHQKWRNRLTRAQSQGLTVRRQNLPLDANHWLFTADQMQQQRRGYRSWPIALTLAFAQQNPGHAKLFQAFKGKDVVAAVLILCHGTSATYHISHSTPLGKHCSAHNLLIWEATTWLAAKGCRHLDLGLINTEDAPGLARFKLGTGARLFQLGGTWLHWPPLKPLFASLARLDRPMMAAT